MSLSAQVAAESLPDHPLVTLLKDHLENWDFVGANKDIEECEDQKWVIENGAWEIVPIIVNYIDEDHEKKCPQLVNACSLLLEKLAERCKPKEILIALIEHCESFQPDVKFLNILPALSIVFRRLCIEPKGKLSLTLDWTLDTLTSHINATVLPEIPSLDDSKEWCTLELMPDIQHILNVVSAFTDFVDPIVTATQRKQKNDISLDEKVRCNQLLTWASMEVLAFPMASLNLTLNLNPASQNPSNGAVKSSARQLTERIVHNICHESTNLMDLIEFDSIKQKFKKDRFSSIKEDENVRWQLAIGTLFYIIYDDASEANISDNQQFIDRLPFVYSPNYLFNLLLPSMSCLMKDKQNYLSSHKAIRLAMLMTERMSTGCMSKEELQMQIHAIFLEALVHNIIYSSCGEVRKSAYLLFERYYRLFEPNHARFRLVNIVLDTANHSGFIGQIIVKIKDTVLLQMTTSDDDMPDKQFTGHNLKILIKKICSLKHGAETDLLEISDEIMASLNMLICVLLRDRENDTGVWDVKDDLTLEYLKPLKTAINLSRAHYQLKVKENPNNKSDIDEVSLMVGGQKLPQMTSNQMSEVIRAALNTFDMMECVLCQLNGILDQ